MSLGGGSGKGSAQGTCCPSCSLLLLLPRDGHVSLQEYMAFMISRETENVKSSEEIESAFRALSSEGKPYVTKEELYQVWDSAPTPAPGGGRKGLRGPRKSRAEGCPWVRAELSLQ